MAELTNASQSSPSLDNVKRNGAPHTRTLSRANSQSACPTLEAPAVQLHRVLKYVWCC